MLATLYIGPVGHHARDLGLNEEPEKENKRK